MYSRRTTRRLIVTLMQMRIPTTYDLSSVSSG
jgi:hypothetical protein